MSSGGKREGSGRKKRYAEPLKLVQVKCPESKAEELRKIIENFLSKFRINK